MVPHQFVAGDTRALKFVGALAYHAIEPGTRSTPRCSARLSDARVLFAEAPCKPWLYPCGQDACRYYTQKAAAAAKAMAMPRGARAAMARASSGDGGAASSGGAGPSVASGGGPGVPADDDDDVGFHAGTPYPVAPADGGPGVPAGAASSGGGGVGAASSGGAVASVASGGGVGAASSGDAAKSAEPAESAWPSRRPQKRRRIDGAGEEAAEDEGDAEGASSRRASGAEP